MKKPFLLLIAIASLPVFAVGQVVEEIVARVNSQIITLSEFQRSKDQLKDDVKQQDPNNADKAFADREKDILRDLIDQQLLLEKAKDLDITGDFSLGGSGAVNLSAQGDINFSNVTLSLDGGVATIVAGGSIRGDSIFQPRSATLIAQGNTDGGTISIQSIEGSENVPLTGAIGLSAVGDAGFDTACVQNYVVNHGGAQTNANVPAGLYEFDFVSPTWSPDLAGWSLLATILLAIIFVIRLAVGLAKRNK